MSNADELLKYKELLDNKIITQEEFEKKKTELLNSKSANTDTVQPQNKNVNLSDKKKSSSNGCLIAFISIICFCIFVAVVISSTTQTKNEKNINLLVNEYNLSIENAESVIDIINQCGYNDYYSGYNLEKGIDNDEIQGSIGFEIQKR